MPDKLKRYSIKLSCERFNCCIDIPNPVTASGGTNATDIAIPVIELSTFGFAYAYAPAIPLNNATRKNKRFECVLESISRPMFIVPPSINIDT